MVFLFFFSTHSYIVSYYIYNLKYLLQILYDFFKLICDRVLHMQHNSLGKVFYINVKVLGILYLNIKLSKYFIQCAFGLHFEEKIFTFCRKFVGFGGSHVNVHILFDTIHHVLVLFMSPTVLFQLTFTIIYSTFSNKFLVSE